MGARREAAKPVQRREIRMTDRNPEQPRYGAVNSSRRDHIARLRQRLNRIKQQSTHPVLGVVSGILDLLEDDSE